MTAHRARAWTALIGLLAIVVGLPAALAATIGNPLSAWPDIRAGDMSERAVMSILAAVAWIAWASFAVAFAVELVEVVIAKIGGRSPRTRRIPLLGFQQDLARTVLAAVFMLAPAVATMAGPFVRAAAVPVAPVLSAHAPLASAAPTPQPAAPAGPAVLTYTVPASGGMDTYWDLAQHYLGAGQRWPQIWHLNKGRAQADGSTMNSPQLLRRGWTVLIPISDGRQTGGHDVTVRRGDTLSGLAADDAIDDWTVAWRMNAGRAEPVGRRFTDPDLILPGWTITLPGPAQASTTTVEPRPPMPAHAPPADPPTPTPTTRPAPAPSPPSEPSPSGARSSAHAVDPAAATPAATSRNLDASTRIPVVFGTGAGTLLAGAALTALLRYRRRQIRHRRPGRTIPSTPPELADAEKALVCSGSTALADVTWLDQALRSLVHTMSKAPGARLPDVIAARLTADDLQLVLATAHREPAPPWTADQDGMGWSLAREADIGFDPAERAYHFAPFPTLASVGYTGSGETWLIDLERVGALSLVGSFERCLNLARFLAAELAHNTWSEQLQMTLVGFGTEMAALNPARTSRPADLPAAVADARGRFERICELSTQVGADVLASRLDNVAADAWTPYVMLAAPDRTDRPAELDALLAAMRTRNVRTPIAVVLAEGEQPGAPTRWQLQLTDDGRLRIPALGVDLIAQQLPAEEAAPLAQLLALAASTDDQAMPASHGDQPWDGFTDAAGGLRPDLAVGAGDVASTKVDDARPWASSTVLPQPTTTYLLQTATTLPDINTLAPPVDERTRREIHAADPTLDDDLAEWHAPHSKRVKLRLLGPPLVTAHGPLPEGRQRTDFYTEVVAFLATRSGATVAQLASALWPNDPAMASKTTPRQAVTIVRRWLGVNSETGRDHLPYGGDGSTTGTYRIEGMLIDAELVRRLRLRGVARGTDGDGIVDLVAALELLDGVPFDRTAVRARRSPNGTFIEPYSWLVDCPLDHEYVAMITDLAHLVATTFLATGDVERATWAAQVALRAGDCSDIPLLDLVAAYMAQDQHALADEYVRRIMGNHDAEVEEDLPPRTYEVLRRLLWTQDSAV